MKNEDRSGLKTDGAVVILGEVSDKEMIHKMIAAQGKTVLIPSMFTNIGKGKSALARMLREKVLREKTIREL